MARWIVPVVLAVLFAWAGGAKLADRDATAEGFRALGLAKAERWAIQLPSVELATAVLLIVAPVGGAIIAIGLLVAFSVVLGRRLAAGSRAPCRCFGDVWARPISWLDILRNAVLAALAAGILVAPPS